LTGLDFIRPTGFFECAAAGAAAAVFVATDVTRDTVRWPGGTDFAAGVVVAAGVEDLVGVGVADFDAEARPLPVWGPAASSFRLSAAAGCVDDGP